MGAPERMFERLAELIFSRDREGVRSATEEALAAGASPQDIVSKGLAPGMEMIGKRYEEGEFFLPELLLGAKAMQAALAILRPRLREGGGGSPGTVVLGTVRGDIHEIGKNIVGAVLESDGFTVHDLGVDVPPEAFVAKAEEVKADVVGLSALISLAVSQMSETVAVLKERGLAARVIVGGAAVTEATAQAIAADAYAKDAWEALRRVRHLVKGREEA